MQPTLNEVSDKFSVVDDPTHYIILCSGESRYSEFWPKKNELIVCEHGIRRRHEMGYSSSKLLEILIECADQIVSREAIFAFAWPGRVVGPNSLNQAISTVRALLGDEEKKEVIQTLPRRGYQFNSVFLKKIKLPDCEAADELPHVLPLEPVIGSAVKRSILGAGDRSLVVTAVLLFAILIWRLDWGLFIQPDLFKASEVLGSLNVLYTGATRQEVQQLQSETQNILIRMSKLSVDPGTVIFNTMHGFLDIVCVEGATADFITVHRSRSLLLTDVQLSRCLR